jgi:hypothetical protein
VQSFGMQVVTSAAETLLEPSNRRKYDSGLASWRRAQRAKESRESKFAAWETYSHESPATGADESSSRGNKDGFDILIGCGAPVSDTDSEPAGAVAVLIN